MGKVNLKVSVCITVFNETKESISKLLDALNKQTLKPDEIIIADASKSKFEIRNSKQIQNLKIINSKNASRSEGRNIAISKARNEIIAITDAGCVPHKDWLYELTKLFKIVTPSASNDTVVAGGYKMIATNDFERAEAVFLGVAQEDIDSNFMPSARSMAFTKSIWKKAGGFPESLNDTAEDTVFNLRLLKAGAKFVTAKNAVVDWQMPISIKNFYLKIKNYARGDAQSGIWWQPVKKLKTHNLKVITIFLRYIFFLLVFLNFGYGYLGGIIGIYMLYSYYKAGFWGILLQLTSDFAIMYAVVNYLLILLSKRKLMG